MQKMQGMLACALLCGAHAAGAPAVASQGAAYNAAAKWVAGGASFGPAMPFRDLGAFTMGRFSHSLLPPFEHRMASYTASNFTVRTRVVLLTNGLPRHQHAPGHVGLFN
jgi:hypothetical protein